MQVAPQLGLCQKSWRSLCQARHSFVDGIHIGKFVDKLQKYLDEVQGVCWCYKGFAKSNVSEAKIEVKFNDRLEGADDTACRS